METVLKYLKQKSTWRGIVAVLTAVGLTMTPGLKEAVITAGVALVGVVEVVFDDDKAK